MSSCFRKIHGSQFLSHLIMITFIQTALLPARVLAPGDKAAVEGSAGQVTSHIIARLRNRQFFDIHEMNSAIRKELDRFNCAEFQKKDGKPALCFCGRGTAFYAAASWLSI